MAITLTLGTQACQVAAAVAATGTITAAGSGVVLSIDTQNVNYPITSTSPAVVNSLAYAGTVGFPAPGTWYVWALEVATGLTAVSSAVTVGAAQGFPVTGVPITLDQAMDLLLTGPLEEVAGLAKTATQPNTQATFLISQNPATITDDLTVPAGTNALWAGPITVASNVVISGNITVI